MVLRLNGRAFEHAKALVGRGRGRVVADDEGVWGLHRPPARRQNAFIRRRGPDEYGKWFLGVDDEKGGHVKGRYASPHGDFERVHRCGVLAAGRTAARYGYADVGAAAAELQGMLEAAWITARGG
jgi:hypothetical protein